MLLVYQYHATMNTPPKRESELAYDKLVELMLSGAITEDQPLSERNLSESLGFGRTPIREAVRDLVREGVLESHPTRGTLLRPLTMADLHDLYELRYAIEGLAAALAAERGPIELLRPYAEQFERTLASSQFDVGVVHDHGVEFHKEIVRLSGNKRLIEMYQPFRLRFRIPFGIVRNRTPERVREAVREHLELLEVIMSRDTELARKLMCEHLKVGLEFRSEMLLKRQRYGF